MYKFLTEKETRTIYKRYHDGLTYKDISISEGGISIETVRVRIATAIRKLRRHKFVSYINYNSDYGSNRLYGTATRLNPCAKMLYDTYSDTTMDNNAIINKIIRDEIDTLTMFDFFGHKRIKLKIYLSTIENIK